MIGDIKLRKIIKKIRAWRSFSIVSTLLTMSRNFRCVSESLKRLESSTILIVNPSSNTLYSTDLVLKEFTFFFYEVFCHKFQSWSLCWSLITFCCTVFGIARRWVTKSIIANEKLIRPSQLIKKSSRLFKRSPTTK